MGFFSEASKRFSSKTIGAILGLLVGIVIITVGFLKALFIALCTLIGYYVGKFIDNPENLRSFLDKILPPGGYR